MTAMPATIESIGRMFAEARAGRRTLAVPAGLTLQSEAEAYRVQDETYARLWPSERPCAWKAGGPNDKSEPTAAPIPPSNVYRSPACIAAAGMNMLGVEAEIGFRLARDLPARESQYSEEEVAAAVDEAVVTIELCATRLADWKNAPALWKLADFQSNGALVVGSGTPGWQAVDFTVQRVECRIGERIVSAVGAHPFGSPFRLLPWAVAHCARRIGGLRAGDIVTTGSWTGLELARAGDEITARFPGIGEAAARIA